MDLTAFLHPLCLSMALVGSRVGVMKITVYTKSVYGRTLVYPADAEQARALGTLTNGAKTLEHRHLIALEALGFIIEQVPDPAALVTLSR